MTESGCKSEHGSQLPAVFLVVRGLNDGPASTRERAVRAYLASILASEWHTDGDRWGLAGLSDLPGGLTLLSFECRQVQADIEGRPVPPGHERWSERQRMRFDATHRVLAKFDELKATHPDWTISRAAVEFTAKFGEWTRQQGLRPTERSLFRYRERTDPNSVKFDGNVDHRGRTLRRRRKRRRSGR